MTKTTERQLLPLLFTLLTVLTLCVLGTWQLQRMQWKNDMIADYKAAQLIEPHELLSLSTEQLTSAPYQSVTITGTFQHQHEFHLGGRRYYGKTGYQLLTPFTLADGRNLLVNRGWVPSEFKLQETRPESLPTGNITLNGIIRIPKAAGLFTPANHPDKNFWFTTDIPAMAHESTLTLLPVTLEVVDNTNPRTHFPAPSNGEVVFRNDHLGYAITWFSLALAALVIYWFRFRYPLLAQQTD